ncbi:MAG: TRAM domain-containing protein [Deltaproteobacteria bacterium]|nr:TRAM domain-containing protein [Deltaproteobacteria bacterium]
MVRRNNLALIGSEQEVLVCDRDERGRLWGRTRGQALDIDGVVFLDRVRAESGDLISVQITGISGYDLRAKRLATTDEQKVQPVDFVRVPL